MHAVLEGAGALLLVVGTAWLGLHRPQPRRRGGYLQRNPDASRFGRWRPR